MLILIRFLTKKLRWRVVKSWWRELGLEVLRQYFLSEVVYLMLNLLILWVLRFPRDLDCLLEPSLDFGPRSDLRHCPSIRIEGIVICDPSSAVDVALHVIIMGTSCIWGVHGLMVVTIHPDSASAEGPWNRICGYRRVWRYGRMTLICLCCGYGFVTASTRWNEDRVPTKASLSCTLRQAALVWGTLKGRTCVVFGIYIH